MNYIVNDNNKRFCCKRHFNAQRQDLKKPTVENVNELYWHVNAHKHMQIRHIRNFET